jgi:DNA-binding MarR family transcriptional regulator
MTSIDDAAHAVLDTVPLAMRAIRRELRSQRSSDLSVSQFRILAFLNNKQECSLSALAGHLGLTLPSTSKMVDGLVDRGLVTRQTCAADRRRIALALSEAGNSQLEAALSHTRARLAAQFSSLGSDECATLLAAMQTLSRIFTGAAEESRGNAAAIASAIAPAIAATLQNAE